MRYEGLVGARPFRVEVTYCQGRAETREQMMVAVSGADELELHPPLLLPTQPRTYACELPAGVIQGGALEVASCAWPDARTTP